MSDQDWLKKAVDKIDSKLDRLDQRQDVMEVTMAKQAESWISHEKRTTLAEENIELLRDEVKPLKGAYHFVKNAIKIISVAGAILLFLHELGLLK